MAAFAAVGCATSSCRVGVCTATSGPGAIHLLNVRYDTLLDHVPVVAIVGRAGRSAIGGSAESEVVDSDLRSFAVPNLNISDGSVLPTQRGPNPALTMMSLAARCADYLISSCRSGAGRSVVP